MTGFICGNISKILGIYAIQAGTGYVCSNDSGIIIERDPDTVRGPDVTFYRDGGTADEMTRGYAQPPPVLAVEVLSPTDRIGSTLRCVEHLLSLGIKVVWVVDVEGREVSVFHGDEAAAVYQVDATLSDAVHLPGLSISIKEIFSLPRFISGH